MHKARAPSPLPAPLRSDGKKVPLQSGAPRSAISAEGRGFRCIFATGNEQRPRPSLFNGYSHPDGPEQALVMEQEVETLLRKEAIKVVPPHDTESEFYSHYFIVPKKDGGLRPILNLRRPEPLSHETQVQDAYYQASRIPNQVRGLVCDDRSERRPLPQIHSSSTSEVLEVRFQGQSIPISSSFRLTLHSHPALSRSVWMQPWLRCVLIKYYK